MSKERGLGTLSADPMPTDKDGSDELYALLQKKADVVEPETATDPKDEERLMVGTMAPYTNPAQRESGTAGAPWGEPTSKQPQRSEGASEGAVETRQGVLHRVFSGTSEAERAVRQQIAQNFAHGARGDFEAHTALLQGASKSKVAFPRSQTLMEQVRRTTGRH